MSNKSIASKIQGLEQRLSAENEHRRREDLLPNSNNSSELHRGTPRRPRLMNITRPGALNLPFSLPAPCHQDSETENRLRDLKMRMNNLTINNHVYASEIKDLDHLGELGNGTCGHVVKMLHKPSQTVIAVKQMRRSGNSEENKRILMDLDIVLRSQCPFIVKCFGCFVTEADVWICMELMASCFDKILKILEGPVPEEILRKVTVSTVKALSYLKEEHGVIHRDVKPSNILVDSRGSIKLCDFGISGRLVDSKAKTRSAGCAAYMAPERIDPPNPQDPDYDIRADVWSLGISLVELATGIFPYRDCQNDFEVLTKVIHDDPPALPDNQSFSPEFRSFVKQCLTKDFSHRPKYNALLQHPFIVQSEASGVRVDQWLQRILPRCETSPTMCASSQNKMDYTDSSPILSFNKSTPLHNGNQSVPAEKAEQEDLSIPSQLEYSTLLEFQKWSIESPDQSFSESSKASCISVDHNSSLNNSCSSSSKISVEDVLTPTDRNGYSDKNNSLENLVISPTYKQVDLENSSSFPSQVDKNMYKAHRSVVQSEVSNPSLPIASNSKTNYSPATGTSPKEYHIQQRGRSLSNTMVCASERLPPRNAAGPFNVKGYLVNSEMRHQPFPGGGPPSLESYVHQDEMHYHPGYPPTYASPELTPRHYFSSNRNRPPPAHSNYDYERSRQQSFNDSQQNLVSPPNCSHGGLENIHDSRVTSPPCFRNNAPTTYFASSYTMAKFNAVPNIGQSYHHNPGGSCSQPASLEAYGDSRHHQQYAVNSRPPEKVYPPVLWSPQLVGKRSAREREERWKNEAQHPQVAGNTSPIVLQRFYHQQSQRRSRRDLRDGSPSQRSVSRDTSIGRSPEPPRRAHRDPSTGRTEPSLPMDEQSILERLEKEREKITPIERERDLHIPDCDSANRQSSKDKERQQPDMIWSQQRYEKDGTHSQKLSNTLPHSLESPESSHTPKDRLELKTRNESLNRSSRERRGEAINGECRNDESHNERDSLTSPKERFEQKLQERRNNKEIYVFPKERERKENNYNGEVMQPGKVTSRGDFLLHSPAASLKPGKSQKDKDEQGWLNSIAGIVRKRFTSYYVKLHLGHNAASGGSDHQSLLSSPPPSAPHYSSPANTNFSKMHKFGGGIPRRIADCDQEISSGVGSIDKKQEYGHFANGYKFKNSAPQPPPRKGSSESWSLPASPLPARPL